MHSYSNVVEVYKLTNLNIGSLKCFARTRQILHVSYAVNRALWINVVPNPHRVYTQTHTKKK